LNITSIPTLTEHDIHVFVGKQNFSKGLQAVRNGAIISPAQQGMILKAYCYGSLPELYHVHVAFEETHITTALCSCSTETGRDGKRRCEHVGRIALRLAFAPGNIHSDGQYRYHPRATKQGLVTHSRQAVASEATRGGMATHDATSPRP
jgi:hypothetical protein